VRRLCRRRRHGLDRRVGRPTTTLWTIPEAHHTGGLESRPREYERRAIRFFDRALLSRR
jgi:hypothetical protein